MGKIEDASPLYETRRRPGWKLYVSLPVLSWALYDFANTIFSSNVNTIFFPLYVSETVGESESLNQIASTFISYANALASFFLVVFSPLYGTWIDRTGRRKKWLGIFTALSVAATLLMGVAGYSNRADFMFGLPASFVITVLLFVAAKFFYHSSLVFYDSMISSLGNKQEIPLISGFGVAVGYVGTLVGLAVYPFVGEKDYYRAFIPSALLFLLFSLPLFFFVKEEAALLKRKAGFFAGYRDIYATFTEMKKYQNIFTFMIAYFFLNDAVATTIAIMSVYAKAIAGFTAGEFILLYLVSTVSSIIGSFLFGYITRSKGAKKAVLYVGILMCVALAIGALAFSKLSFWIAGSLFGVSLGAMWVTSRTYIVELSPKDKQGQFFGLFAFSGKVSAIIGPAIYGSITLVFHSYGNIANRLAMGALLVMVLLGIFFLRKVKPQAPAEPEG
ncbi:MFS transporter [Saccharococcus caldoxylosilyticus]|uniref:MFS transporter n=1 Tax=Saccharococcus caldoxylosilyticus TaxID=81408 RepID=UPI001FCC8079|nr:MFS transporter [Parageobacillus caldoxylosilyticus]BDG37632.1 MFS transporter [Parageobacillus caldoxylosilyticus]BDG41424.1 MFS transporter [Parageobacillus caldoxylosilyticus]